MNLKKIALIAGAGAACIVTGGMAAPAIGAVVGSTFMGLSGAAATSAGLAALGGGSLAAGGAGMAGGTALVSAIAGGVGAAGVATASNIAEGNKAKKDLRKTQEDLDRMQKSDSKKQKIITILEKKLKSAELNYEILRKDADATKEELDEAERQIKYILDELEKVKSNDW